MAIEVLASGMVTPLGFSSPSSCSALRAGVYRMRDTRFRFDDEWVKAGSVNFPDGAAGLPKMRRMVAMAIAECLAELPSGWPEDTALHVCLPELARPGRMRGLDEGFIGSVRAELREDGRLERTFRLHSSGAVGGIQALQEVEESITREHARYAIVAGVDTYLLRATLLAYRAQGRLRTENDSNGFTPGEAAAAVLIGPPSTRRGAFQALGSGIGTEAAVQGSGIPLRARGLTQAYSEAFARAGVGYGHVDYRLADVSGEHREFKEASVALAATMRIRKERFDLEHPTESTGRVGAASVPLLLGVAMAAARKRYSAGPGVLCHFSGDGGSRGAIVLREYGKDSHPPLED